MEFNEIFESFDSCDKKLSCDCCPIPMRICSSSKSCAEAHETWLNEKSVVR